MSTSERISAAVGYIPVIGWIYAYFFQRKNELVMFHLKQSISLFLDLIVVLLLWAVVGWVLTWIPYGNVVAITLFTVVMLAFFVGFIAWVIGIANALRGLLKDLPLFNTWVKRLPI
jgi:uncharacterized membrane protein